MKRIIAYAFSTLILPVVIIGCAPSSKTSQALSQLAAENQALIAQREHYKGAAEKAQAAIRAAYAKGVKDGHSTVLCQPSWPALEVISTPAGFSLRTPVPAKGAICDAGFGPDRKFLEAHCRGPIAAGGKCDCVLDNPNTFK